jgi:hypothetical protein
MVSTRSEDPEDGESPGQEPCPEGEAGSDGPRPPPPVEGSGEPPRRKAGRLKGQITVGPEFFEPLPEEELALWEGGT